MPVGYVYPCVSSCVIVWRCENYHISERLLRCSFYDEGTPEPQVIERDTDMDSLAILF